MQQEFNLSGVSVQIGIPAFNGVSPQTTVALIDTCLHLQKTGIPGDVKIQYGCSIITQARSFVADEFLRSEATHLFMIDADINWTSADFVRLLALATKMEVVAGIYPLKTDPESWAWAPGVGIKAVNEWGCLPINGLGLGFCCVQRKIIEELADLAPKLKFAHKPEKVAVMFRCDQDADDNFRGEDIAFFADIRRIGYDVWLDPTINLGHVGAKEYRGDFMAALEQQKVPQEDQAWQKNLKNFRLFKSATTATSKQLS